MERIKNLYLVLSVITAILTLLGIVTGFFSKAWGWIKNKIKTESATYNIPKKTITILPKPHPNATSWHMGSSKDKPAMQIAGTFTVTNITKYNILLTVAKMKKPKKILGAVMVSDIDSQYHGNYYIPPGATTNLIFDFWIIPPFKKQGENFIADIEFLDQFGNKHLIKKVEFKYN
ncbi:MAG: hypothetical protein WCZ89_03745 [Phycisphaerae bacterium]